MKIDYIMNVILGLFVIIVAISPFLFAFHILSRGECVERAPFDIGNEMLGASGTYCKRWSKE